jgi:hypothetical protein
MTHQLLVLGKQNRLIGQRGAHHQTPHETNYIY